MWAPPSSAATWRTRVAALRGDACSFGEKSELSFSPHCPLPLSPCLPWPCPFPAPCSPSLLLPLASQYPRPNKHMVHRGQDLWKKGERSSQAPSSGHVVHAVTPPSTQPLLPGRLFEETGEVAQVSYENRKWLSEGSYHVREGSCVLSLVSGQQR